MKSKGVKRYAYYETHLDICRIVKVTHEARQERERMTVEMMFKMASSVAPQLAKAPLVSKIKPKLVKWLHIHSVCTWLLLSLTTCGQKQRNRIHRDSILTFSLLTHLATLIAPLLQRRIPKDTERKTCLTRLQ